MNRKIIFVHHGPDFEIFPLLSLAIGLKKKYPDHKLFWAGAPHTLPLIKYNPRIDDFLDITGDFTLDMLQSVFKPDICINGSPHKVARGFASQTHAEKHCGITQNSFHFFTSVMTGKIKTNKTVLQLYYEMADLYWNGEGFALNYYPKTKQIEKYGIITQPEICKNDKKVKMPEDILSKLDTINKYEKIVTDDLFVAYAAISLRKNCTFLADNFPYRLEFFGNGKIKSKGK